MRKHLVLLMIQGVVLFFLFNFIAKSRAQVVAKKPFDQGDTTPVMLNQVVIEVTMAHRNTPMAYANVGAEAIAPLQNGQDLPYLLRFTPSLVVTSDAGNGVGYTGMWIRGSDPSRVNVSINGITLNDPESQQVFWVNTPDFGTSASMIQVQRGVGTSASGVGAFGGSVKIETRDISYKPGLLFSSHYGSYGTRKNTLVLQTGTLREKFKMSLRLSEIASDGYIDRASTSLLSGYFEALYQQHRQSIQLVAFSGKERTYQSWYGSPWEVLYGNASQRAAFAERNGLTSEETQNLLSSGRTYNYYQYPDQVDLYGQDHIQVHFNRAGRWYNQFNASINYTRGAGYFEEEKRNEAFERYGLQPLVLSGDTILETDVVRRRWLKNHYYGATFSLLIRRGNLDFTWGGSAHQYLGEHFGELTQLQWAFGVDRNHRYYEGHSAKNDAQSYVRMNIRLNKKWDLYGDLQGRWVDYKTDGVDNDLLSYAVDTQFVFFNPKAGIEYRPSQKWRYYVSVARGNKEPNRNDFVDVNRATSVKHESMIDGELGVERQSKDLFWAINGYWMQYQNQLVLNGQLNDVGAPLRINVDKSYRAGIEAQASYLIKRNNNQQWSAQGNATWSHNRIAFFEQVVYDYSEDDVRIVSEKLKNVPISFSPDWIAGAQLRYDRFTLYPEELTMRTVTAEEAKIRTRAPFSVMLMWKLVGQQMMDNTGNKDLQIDAYQVWDGRVSYEWISKTHGAACEFSFGVNNILNLDYVSNGYTYSYIWGDKVTERFYYPQALRTWNIGLKVTI